MQRHEQTPYLKRLVVGESGLELGLLGNGGLELGKIGRAGRGRRGARGWGVLVEEREGSGGRSHSLVPSGTSSSCEAHKLVLADLLQMALAAAVPALDSRMVAVLLDVVLRSTSKAATPHSLKVVLASTTTRARTGASGVDLHGKGVMGWGIALGWSGLLEFSLG